MSDRTVHVKRTLTIEYSVPTRHYDGMSEDEIRAWEADEDAIDPGTLLDNIVSDTAEVWFSGGDA